MERAERWLSEFTPGELFAAHLQSSSKGFYFAQHRTNRKNSDRSHPNFSSSNPFVPSKRRTYRLTNYPIEFICIKRDTRLYHAPLCKFILIFVTRHRPFPFSPSPSSPLSSTRFLDHAHKSPETFCCTLWREREREGEIEFLRRVIKIEATR